MKQVTIAGVKDFINEIEKGGLSLREEYVLACLRELVAVTEQRDAAVAENAMLNEKMDKLATWPGIEFYSSAWEFTNSDGNEALEYMCDTQTPATSSAIAAMRAEGVDLLTEFAGQEYQNTSNKDEKIRLRFVVSLGTAFARQLRESKGEVQS